MVKEIKNKILKDLDIDIPPTYSRYGLRKEEFISLLDEMQDEKYLTYTKIKDHPIFEGEPKNIYITEQGRKKANKKAE